MIWQLYCNSGVSVIWKRGHFKSPEAGSHILNMEYQQPVLCMLSVMQHIAT